MNTYRIAATTRAGHYIETEITASNMLALVQPMVFELQVQHKVAIDDVVELDITELE
jgi:hypothetical protein